ncbi:hypothetical protein CE195_09100 [Sodalis-like symbiont of Philaenus spumarius]|nr:hypothetical protein CE195_09100 [Sodalis-like symbiont of Philaenus spumarius]
MYAPRVGSPKSVAAVGHEAKQMLGCTPGNIAAICVCRSSIVHFIWELGLYFTQSDRTVLLSYQVTQTRGHTLRQVLGTFRIIRFSHSCIHLGELLKKYSQFDLRLV